MTSHFTTYKAAQLCPICGHNGWCRFLGPIDNPTIVQCARVSEGAMTYRDGRLVEAKNGQGWFHRLREDPHRQRHVRVAPTPDQHNPNLSVINSRCQESITPEMLATVAESLGVSGESLRKLGIGWCEEYIHWVTGEVKTVRAFSFPMRGDGNMVVGIRFRNQQGHKWAATGSINALFIPRQLPSGALWIVEGPTETAAMLDLGFSAIGRPSNTAGKEYLVAFAKRFLPRRSVVVAINRDPSGSDAERLTLTGAAALVQQLVEEKACASISLVMPPKTKDFRDWKRAGASRRDVENLIVEGDLLGDAPATYSALAILCDAKILSRKIA